MHDLKNWLPSDLDPEVLVCCLFTSLFFPSRPTSSSHRGLFPHSFSYVLHFMFPTTLMTLLRPCSAAICYRFVSPSSLKCVPIFGPFLSAPNFLSFCGVLFQLTLWLLFPQSLQSWSWLWEVCPGTTFLQKMLSWETLSFHKLGNIPDYSVWKKVFILKDLDLKRFTSFNICKCS